MYQLKIECTYIKMKWSNLTDNNYTKYIFKSIKNDIRMKIEWSLLFRMYLPISI